MTDNTDEVEISVTMNERDLLMRQRAVSTVGPAYIEFG